MSNLKTGKNYLPDSGFTNGWRFPDDGGSNAWGVPPIIGFNPEEFMGEGAGGTRDDYLQDGLGGVWDALEVKPLYEDWQKTPGNALYIVTDPDLGSGGVYLDNWVPVVPTRRYVVRYGKKITGTYLPYAKLYVRILWCDASKTSYAESNIGYDDNDVGVYKYEQELDPPSRTNGWPKDPVWAHVMIYAMGAGGTSFAPSIEGYIDDVEFAALSEAPTEIPEEPGAVDPGSIENEVGLWMYDALQPLQYKEAQLGFPLLAFVDAIGGMFQPTYNIVRDANIMLDPDRTPVGWLPWLAQFVGQPLPGGQLPDEPDYAFRERMTPYIKNPPHRRRGTVPAILEEVKKLLVPDANVYAVERQGGDLYIGSIGVIESQMNAGVTLDQIQARVEEVAPAGRIITVTTIAGGDWLSLRTTHADWADVLSTYEDWAEVKANPTL